MAKYSKELMDKLNRNMSDLVDPSLHVVEVGLCDDAGRELSSDGYRRSPVPPGASHVPLPCPHLAHGWMLFSDGELIVTNRFATPSTTGAEESVEPMVRFGSVGGSEAS